MINKLHYALYESINDIRRDPEPSQIDSHLDAVESLIEFLVTQSKSPIKIEQIDTILLSVFYSISCLVHFTQPAQRLDAKVCSILTKIYTLFETKLCAFDETSNFRSTLFKCLKFDVYLIEHIKDPKCIVALWKLFCKLVFKLKVIVPSSDKEYNVIRKIFTIMFNDQKVIFEFFFS